MRCLSGTFANNTSALLIAILATMPACALKITNSSESSATTSSKTHGLINRFKVTNASQVGMYGINRYLGNTSTDYGHVALVNGKIYSAWAELDSNVGITAVGRISAYNPTTGVWTNVDSNGFNYNIADDITGISVLGYGTKLYLSWSENGTTIRAKTYDTSTGLWAYIDGGGVTGLNYNAARYGSGTSLASIGSKVYLAWVEDKSGTGDYNVRVASYTPSTGTWTFIDGGGASGLNYDSTKSASSTKLLAVGTKLYAIWNEYDGAGVLQVRASVYDTAAPGWTRIDGSGAAGINYDSTQDASLGGVTTDGTKVFVSWNEAEPAGVSQTRVVAYNPSAPGWSFIDGGAANGLNYDSVGEASYTSSLIALNGKLYVAFTEAIGMTQEVRAKVYDISGGTWSWIDGGGATSHVSYSSRYVENGIGAITDGTTLYFEWYETSNPNYQLRFTSYSPATSTWNFLDATQATGLQYDVTAAGGTYGRLAAYNGKFYATWVESLRTHVKEFNPSTSTWTFVDGGGFSGINFNSARSSSTSTLVSTSSSLYAIWTENNAGAVRNLRAAKFNPSNTTWTMIDGGGANGINYNSAKAANAPAVAALSETVYAAWTEVNAGGIAQIRVAKYTPNSSGTWTFVDGGGANGINYDSTKAANTPYLYALNNRIYATWTESNGVNIQVRAAYYNPFSNTWTFIDGGGASGLNYSSTKDVQVYPRLESDGSNLYLAWRELDAGAVAQLHVSKYVPALGTWTSLDGGTATGMNYDSTNSATISSLVAAGNYLYLIWQENAPYSKYSIRVKAYDYQRQTWQFVDGGSTGGVILDPSRSMTTGLFAIGSGYEMYLMSTEGNQIMVYNGTD